MRNAGSKRASSQAHEGWSPPAGLVHETLANGAEILVLPTEPFSGVSMGGGVAAVQLWVLAGTNAEADDEHGCAHLLEHLLFKPATAASGKTVDVTASIEALGGDVNAFTSHDETVFHATVPAGQIAAAIDGMLGPLLQPRIDPKELRAEIGVVVEEIRQDRDDPGARLSQDVAQALFGSHGYARSVLGEIASVRGHDAERLRRFHRRHYAAQRLRLVVVGPVRPRAVVDRARAWLADRPRGTSASDHADRLPDRTRPWVAVRRLDIVEAHLVLGWTAPPLPKADACALEVASVVLGYGEASRLATAVRRRARLVTDVYASLYASRVASNLLVGAHAPIANLTRAVLGVLEQVDALARAPIDDEELARAKAVLRSDLVYRRETAAGHAHALGYLLSIGGDLSVEGEYFARLSAITPADVQRACARWLAGRRAAVALGVPRDRVDRSRAAELAKLVRRRLTVVPKKPGRPREREGIVTLDHDSGIRVRALIDRRVPIAAGWMLWPGGLRLETPATNGTSAMMAKLLTRGCEAIDGDALAREIEGRAAVLDGFCGKSSAGLHFESMTGDFQHVLTRALQSILAPRFDAHDLEEERRVAIEALLGEEDDLGKIAVRTVLTALYRGHPYRMRRRGSPSSLRRLTADALRERWPSWYPRSRMILGLCGDIDLDAVMRVLDTELFVSARSKRAALRPRWPVAKWRAGTRARTLRRGAGRQREQVHVAVAYPGLSFRDERTAVLDVLVAILGGQVGRLFIALRERQGLVYHVSAAASQGFDAGDVVVYAATGREHAERTEAAIRHELHAIASARVTDEELAHAKAYLAGQHDAELERRGRVASLLAIDEAFALGTGAFMRYPDHLRAVTADDVLRLARRVLDDRKSVTAIVG